MKTAIENLLLILAALLTKPIFLAYQIFTTTVAVGLLFGLPLYLLLHFCPPLQAYWWYPLPVLVLLALLRNRKAPPRKDNPYRRYVGWTGWRDATIDRLIAWIGTIKYFTSPICLVEDPGSYKIKGHEIRTLLDEVLQPGDILLRGYDGYLDGVMIGLSGGGKSLGNHFSHAALYLGDLSNDTDKPIVARRLQVVDTDGNWIPASEQQKEAVRNDPNYYEPGRQKVVHSMTKGVFVEDILTFLRCDYLVVLRVPNDIRLSTRELTSTFQFKALGEDAEAIQARLLRGESVNKSDILNAVHRSALGKIGSCYDFQFSDIKTGNRFSCSEFVYYCYKSIHRHLDLQPKKHAFIGMFARTSITPADIYDAAETSDKLDIAWKSQSLG